MLLRFLRWLFGTVDERLLNEAREAAYWKGRCAGFHDGAAYKTEHVLYARDTVIVTGEDE